MFRLIKGLFTGDFHLHKWKIINKSDYTSRYFNGPNIDFTEYTLQCEVCGHIKVTRGDK